MNEYEELLTRLVGARQVADTEKQHMSAITAAAHAAEDYMLAKEIYDDAQVRIEDIELEIKEIALEEYKTTKNKSVHPSITVKIFKTFKVINPAQVLLWVKSNLADALVPDMKKVENYATKIGAVAGTEIGEEARAQIASKL